jgi:hypothetical protein
MVDSKSRPAHQRVRMGPGERKIKIQPSMYSQKGYNSLRRILPGLSDGDARICLLETILWSCVAALRAT